MTPLSLEHITNIYFDLDHTLWDFEENSKVTLQKLFDLHELKSKLNTNFESVLERYKQINFEMWRLYNNAHITKEQLREQRFRQLFYHFGITNNTLADQINSDYIESCPITGILMDGCIGALEYLFPKYNLHIITNSFDLTTQRKLRSTKILRFFKTVTTSESAKSTKPHKKIFSIALGQRNTKNCIMVGDNLFTDIKGAVDFGMSGIWYNPKHSTPKTRLSSNYLEINRLTELTHLL